MIYMLKSGEYIKIGYTQSFKSLPQRLENYFTHNPNITLIGFKEGDRQKELEIHKKLSKFKCNTSDEWFKVSNEVYDKLFKYFNPENKIYVMIGFEHKTKACVKEKELEEYFIDVHNYALKYFNSLNKDFYRSEELKELIININKEFGIHLNVRPASVGLLVGIRKATVRIPVKDGGGTFTAYKYIGENPNYCYNKNY